MNGNLSCFKICATLISLDHVFERRVDFIMQFNLFKTSEHTTVFKVKMVIRRLTGKVRIRHSSRGRDSNPTGPIHFFLSTIAVEHC